MPRLSLGLFFLGFFSFPVAAQQGPVDFNREIRPILSNFCFKCHGPGKQEGGLRLDVRESALRRKIIVPGKHQASKIFERLLSTEDDRMPPPEAGEKLSPELVARLQAWIDQGAEYAPHWAFQKPRLHPLPAVREKGWIKNGIDYFILAELEKQGLKPSPQADRSTLIRRASLDLLGLLPSPQDVEAFLKDPRPDAYEHLIDRLLESPHYGERQARHWLDLARYADTNGFTIDGKRTIWPYRDWVIQAFNRDLPFDQFTIEQLAGDQLPKASLQQQVATGFQRNTPLNEEGGTDAEQFRAERTVDRTNTIGSVWLGLTLGCAQCHNHKYDPITIREYYQVYAFFNSADETKISLTTPEQEKKLAQLKVQLEEARKVQAKAGKDPKALAEAKAVFQKASKTYKEFEDTLPTSLALKEGNNKNRVTYIHERGDFLAKGPVVQAGTLEVLPSLKTAPEQKLTRLDLARWLVSPDNPLTPRVVVNRIWQQYFGKGIVETENDFGMQGALPSHPELLDWLAVELLKNQWSLKKIHRLIVLSATYRQESIHREDLQAKDPKNVLLGRQNRIRLEAEIIRDAALCASGLLNPTIGGPGVYPPQPPEVFRFTQNARPWPESKGPDRFRRGMYTFIQRQAQHPLLTTFDAADAQTSCTRRNRSNTPLQALHLANDPVFLEFAQGLGKRILKEAPKDEAARADYAYRLCFARSPSLAERDRLLGYLRLVPTKEESQAWTMAARVLLNLDEFISRE